jgi:hypothetical protein
MSARAVLCDLDWMKRKPKKRKNSPMGMLLIKNKP